MELAKHAASIIREMTRHLLRRPVVGICAIAQTADGRVLLIRRGDSGKWALPGGTLEWNETLRKAIEREVEEETGATFVKINKVTGVYSRPDRDWRFHGVTIAVTAEIAEPIKGPKNKLEIREARLFARNELPKDLDFGGTEILDHALSEKETEIE